MPIRRVGGQSTITCKEVPQTNVDPFPQQLRRPHEATIATEARIADGRVGELRLLGPIGQSRVGQCDRQIDTDVEYSMSTMLTEHCNLYTYKNNMRTAEPVI
jgi:hypothetical protein